MSLQPVNPEQVQSTAQVLLAFLSDENVNIPGNLLEGIVSGKSLLRGLLSGQLVICQNTESAPKVEDGKPVKKKVAKKVAKKDA